MGWGQRYDQSPSAKIVQKIDLAKEKRIFFLFWAWDFYPSWAKYKIKVEKLLFLFPRRSLPYLKVVQKSEMSKEKSKTFIDKCDSVTSVTTFFSYPLFRI